MLAVENSLNVVTVGGTGSGKTTFSKTLIDLYPIDRRLITVEDAHELTTPNHPNSEVKGQARQGGRLVEYPAKYPWSSYAFNTFGKEDQLITAHSEYRRMDPTEQDRQSAYRQLFRARIPSMTQEALREATNKACVMGSERFKARVSKHIDRPLQSSGHGGDRKSEVYRHD